MSLREFEEASNDRLESKEGNLSLLGDCPELFRLLKDCTLQVTAAHIEFRADHQASSVSSSLGASWAPTTSDSQCRPSRAVASETGRSSYTNANDRKTQTRTLVIVTAKCRRLRFACLLAGRRRT